MKEIILYIFLLIKGFIGVDNDMFEVTFYWLHNTCYNLYNEILITGIFIPKILFYKYPALLTRNSVCYILICVLFIDSSFINNLINKFNIIIFIFV